MEQNIPFVYKDFWPNGEPYALGLSHDVDWLRKYRLRSIVKRMINRDIEQVKDIVYTLIGKKKDPWWNFGIITRGEKKRNVRSTFFFLGRFHSQFGKRYSIKSAANVIRKLLLEGFEIGLHKSFGSSVSQILAEKIALERICGAHITGVREHYLGTDPTFQLVWAQEAGFMYDSTVGYRDISGFRAGIALPYYPFNFAIENAMELLELPLTIMDTALFNEGSSPNITAREILTATKQGKGLCVLLWHQRSFSNSDFPGWQDVYWSIIDTAVKDGAFIAPLNKIAEWWKAREDVKILYNTQNISIQSSKPIETITLNVYLPPGWEIDTRDYGVEEACIDEKTEAVWAVTLNGISKGQSSIFQKL